VDGDPIVRDYCSISGWAMGMPGHPALLVLLASLALACLVRSVSSSAHRDDRLCVNPGALVIA